MAESRTPMARRLPAKKLTLQGSRGFRIICRRRPFETFTSESIREKVAWVCGLNHERKTIPFARTLHRNHPWGAATAHLQPVMQITVRQRPESESSVLYG